jgi:hypothetical protein
MGLVGSRAAKTPRSDFVSELHSVKVLRSHLAGVLLPRPIPSSACCRSPQHHRAHLVMVSRSLVDASCRISLECAHRLCLSGCESPRRSTRPLRSTSTVQRCLTTFSSCWCSRTTDVRRFAQPSLCAIIARLPVSVFPSAFVPFGHLGCGSSAQGAPGANMAGGRAVAGVTMPDVDGRLKIGL